MGDKEGARFPWRPRPLAAVLADADAGGGALLEAATGEPLPAGHLRSLDYVGLYFSAHWCGPCRGFTPGLADWYATHVASGALAAKTGKSFDIVFVSSDHSVGEFDAYRAEMPWKAAAYALRGLEAELSRICAVKGIPTLALVRMRGGADGATPVVVDAGLRAKILKRPDDFPWGPAPVSSLEEAAGDFFNKAPTLILFTDALTDAAAEAAALATFREVAAEHFDAAELASKQAVLTELLGV